MKIKRTTIFCAALVALSLSSCDKWLDIKPADRIVEENVFDTPAGILSALNGTYNELLNSELYGSTLGSEFIEILGQQYNIRTTNVNYTEVSNYAYPADYTKGRLERTWDAAYKVILNSNKIIENVEKRNSTLPSNIQDIVLGESLAIRAFIHFDMLRLFGPIYKTSASLKSIPYVHKISVSPSPLLPAEEVIKHIINDLDRAESYLLKSDPIVNEGPQNTVLEGADNTFRYRTFRFNYYAILALKARVHLYAGDKENALKYAKMIIEDTKRETYFPFVKHTDITGNFANPDRVFSTEIITGLYHSGRNLIFQNYFNPGSAQSANLLIPRAGNIAALFSGEESDYRYSYLWQDYDLEVNTLYNLKFRVGETTTLYRNTILPLIRLGEMYLIATESESNEQLAYAYLNKLRNQRGLPSVTDNLAVRLRNEYVKELYGEGQLFFYYKRTNAATIKSGITNANISMTAARYVPMLPDSENRYRD